MKWTRVARAKLYPGLISKDGAYRIAKIGAAPWVEYDLYRGTVVDRKHRISVHSRMQDAKKAAEAEAAGKGARG